MDTKEKSIREEMGSLSKKMQGILDKAEEEERDLTEEEQKQFDSYKEEWDAEKKKLDNHLAAKEANDFGDQKEQNKYVERKEGIEVGESREDSWELRVVRYFNALAISKDDQAEGMRQISELRKKYKGLSDQKLEAERKDALNTIGDSKLSRWKKRMARHSIGANTRLHTTSTTDTPKAGYLLPKPFLAEVFVLIEQYGVARRLFRSVPMTSKSIDLKNLASKVVAAWTDEGANITADDLVFSEGSLDANKLAGLTNWTTELSEDQAIALLPVVVESFAESMAKKEDEAAFLGDGTATYGGFTGILNLSGAEVETFATGSTAGTDLDESHIRAMKASVSTASRMGARWFMEYSVLDHVSQLENSAGNRLFANAFSDGNPGTILGDPVTLVDVMPKIGAVAADTPFIAYGNPNRALFGLRRGMTADISREAVVQNASGDIVYNAFQADGAILRLTQRVGIKVPSAFEGSFAVAATAAS